MEVMHRKSQRLALRETMHANNGVEVRRRMHTVKQQNKKYERLLR